MTVHPWFGFEPLKLSRLRPLIGYGPDTFRYAYLLKSPSRGQREAASRTGPRLSSIEGSLDLWDSQSVQPVFKQLFLDGAATLVDKAVDEGPPGPSQTVRRRPA